MTSAKPFPLPAAGRELSGAGGPALLPAFAGYGGPQLTLRADSAIRIGTAQGGPRMRYTAAAALMTMTAPCMAQDFPPLHSLWRETQQHAWCLEITEVSELLPGSDDCVRVSGSLGSGLVSGYACATGSVINLFHGMGSDNSIGPDIFLGTFSSKSMLVQYCFRESNDWPPVYNCENDLQFDHVISCDP